MAEHVAAWMRRRSERLGDTGAIQCLSAPNGGMLRLVQLGGCQQARATEEGVADGMTRNRCSVVMSDRESG